MKVKPFDESGAFIRCNAYFSHMNRFVFTLLVSVFLLSACDKKQEATLASFAVFCEMVQYGAKPVALSNPMSPELADVYETEFQNMAKEGGLEIYREDLWPLTVLFPWEFTEGMTVFLIYKDGNRLTQYLQLKDDIKQKANEPELLARRLGRLLGYDVQGINRLLMQNTDFRTYASFGVTDQVTHLYYEDVPKAMAFYEEKLGLFKEGENQFKISLNASIQINPVSDEYPAGLPKSTAIALLTDNLPGWYAHVQEQDIPIKYTYKPREGGPHDGFVAIDPEGYLLEFEQFKQHPENELFMAALENTVRIATSIDHLSFNASITWTYHQDLLAQESYYNEVLGFKMVANQGWTKIYQTSNSSFIGLVDERRGMEDYADKKAVKIEWSVKEESEMANYALKRGSMIGPENYEYIIK